MGFTGRNALLISGGVLVAVTPAIVAVVSVATPESDGPTQIAVNSVDVTGDDAVANVRFVAANHEDPKTLDIDFLRDGADWKACRYHPAQSI